MASLKSQIQANLTQIRQNIAAACSRCGRDPASVTVVAVTKSATVDAVKCAVDQGLLDLGESRVQQLIDRSQEVAQYVQRRKLPPVRWHMIGHLQRNKVKAVLETASIIHSVDTLRLAEDINARAEAAGTVAEILIQVNCSAEPQKYGVAVGAASHLCSLVSSLRNIRPVGLMTMAPLAKDPQAARPAFTRLRELFEEMRHDGVGGEAFRHLSMGMSQDYVVAIEEGATLVRIGRAIFG